MSRPWRSTAAIRASRSCGEYLRAAAQHLNPGGGLLCEVGRCREALEAAYPDLDFLWIDTEESSGEVFWVTKEQLEGRVAKTPTLHPSPQGGGKFEINENRGS